MDLEDENEYDQQMDEEDDDEEITQEDAWAVISAYFEEKGLVRQQLDSFDEFIQNTMQEIVDESADIEIRPESQHNPGHQSDFAETIYKISFGHSLSSFVYAQVFEQAAVKKLGGRSLNLKNQLLKGLRLGKAKGKRLRIQTYAQSSSYYFRGFHGWTST
ncbi:DNA-directed RNA polymerase II subunit RPB2 [Trifolium repens]|nr:DNA-directed RNA polymerase II subunit RPB2 [Trifolium repens]